MTTCRKCRTAKPDNEFFKCARKKNGLQSYCKQCSLRLHGEFYEKNKEADRAATNARQKAYYHKNKEVCLRNSAAWQKANAEKMNERRRSRRRADPLLRLAIQLRVRLNTAIRRSASEIQGVSAVRHLGCSIEELKSHLESLFSVGMTWGNWGRGLGKWNIDHVVPLSSAKTEEDMRRLCHWTNLQPLWFLDNVRKGGRMPTDYAQPQDVVAASA